MKNAPWKQLKKRVVFKSQYLTVCNDLVRQPNGAQGHYAYMDHGGGVGVVVVDEQHDVYLLREYKYPVRVFGLHLPSGGIELGEAALTAAKRELKEEIGFTARKWSALGKLAATDGMSSEIAYLFLAEQIAKARIKPPALEPLTIVRIPLKKAVKMVLDSRITCSYAITGIIRAAAKLKML